MAKRYRIDVELSLRKAEAEANKLGAVLAKGEAKLAKDAEKAEAAVTRSAKRQADAKIKESERASKAAQRESEKAAAAAQREAERAAKAMASAADKTAKDAERASAAAVRRAERDAARLEMIQDRYIKKAYDNDRRLETSRDRAAARQVMTEARKHKQLMTDADIALAVQNKAVDNANKKRTRAALDAAGVERRTWSEAIKDATGFTATMTKLGATVIAVQAIGKAVGLIAAGFVEAQRKSKEFFDELIDTAADLRELATINEKGAPDADLIRQHIELRRTTGLGRSEATGFATELGNALGVVSEDQLPAAERSKLVIEGGKFAARGGGGAEAVKARASMLAMITNYMPKGATAKGVAAQADAIDVILGKGSASQQVMTEQYRDVLTALSSNDPESQGLLKDPRQAAALTALASGFNPTAPAHSTMMAARQARKFTNFRKTKGMTASATETLTKAGVKETDDPVQSMVKMFEFAKANMGKEEAFDTFLARRGFREPESNRNLGKFYERWKSGDFDRVMGMAAGAVDQDAPDRKFEEFARQPLTAALIARQKAQTARLQVGLERQPLESAKLDSEESAVRRDVNGAVGAARGLFGLFTGGLKSGREYEIEKETIARLQKLPGGAETQAPLGYRLSQAVDPLGIMGTEIARSVFGLNDEYIDALKRNTDATMENNRLMQGQAAPGVKGQAPMPLRPAPKGNGGVM